MRERAQPAGEPRRTIHRTHGEHRRRCRCAQAPQRLDQSAVRHHRLATARGFFGQRMGAVPRRGRLPQAIAAASELSPCPTAPMVAAKPAAPAAAAAPAAPAEALAPPHRAAMVAERQATRQASRSDATSGTCRPGAASLPQIATRSAVPFGTGPSGRRRPGPEGFQY